MAEFSEVMKQKMRMCNKYSKDWCRNCQLASENNRKMASCNNFLTDCYDEAEEIIMNWAKENPTKTNRDKFEEVFGMGIRKNLQECVGFDCPMSYMNCSECEYKGFWDKEYVEPKNK